MAVYGPSGNEELYHYGVLGMKWGIRHDKDKAYTKSKAKQDKLDEKYEKAKSKQKKATANVYKKQAGLFYSDKKLSKAMTKLDKSNRKLVRRADKGRKWIESMKKNFATVNVKLDDQSKDRLDKYLKELDVANARVSDLIEKRRVKRL